MPSALQDALMGWALGISLSIEYYALSSLVARASRWVAMSNFIARASRWVAMSNFVARAGRRAAIKLWRGARQSDLRSEHSND